MTSPLYTIERWPHGWTISSVPEESGVPINALDECLKLFPKNSVVDTGIAGHLRRGRGMSVVFAIGLVNDLSDWRREITASLAGQPREIRWWRGLDVGTSSASIFGVFSNFNRISARELGRGSVPLHADDFGRCKRLLDLFPEWRADLGRVAEAYPDTLWPRLIPRWAELEAADVDTVNSILRNP